MWPDMQAADVQRTVPSPMRTHSYLSDAHDDMLFQVHSTYNSMSSSIPPLLHDNLAAIDQLRNISSPRDTSSRNYADGIEHTTVGTATASLMEVDSPTPSPGSIQEPAGNWEKRTESRHQSWVAGACAQSAVGLKASSSEGLGFAAY
jgi:hypothetical protein